MTKKETETNGSGEQLDLIDVTPENVKEIKELLHPYKKVQAKRIAALNKELELKDKILSLIKAANLEKLPNGSIKFRCEGMIITLKPTDEKLTIKEEKAKDEVE